MDILKYSNGLFSDLGHFCSKELIEHVFGAFEKKAIVQVLDEEKESIWDLTDFIKQKNEVGIAAKIEVMLSFLHCGATIIYDNQTYYNIIDLNSLNGEIQLLYTMKKDQILTEEQVEEFYGWWIEFEMYPQFSLTEDGSVKVEPKPKPQSIDYKEIEKRLFDRISLRSQR